MKEKSGAEQIAEIIGLKEERVVVGGEKQVTLRLRPLSLKDYIELTQTDFGTSLEALLHQAHVCAQRGGYEGTKEQLAELIEGDEIIALETAVENLAPLLMARGRQRLGLPVAPVEAPAPEGSSEPSGE